MRRKKAIRVSLAARIERTKPEGRKSRDEGQTSLRFPFPSLQLRFIQSSTLAGKPTSVCDVVASVSSPNTQHPDKYEIPSTKHGGSLLLSLSFEGKEGRKEEAARHRWWLCILAGGRGKIPWFTKNRAGGMAIEVENEREREREERNLDSSFRTLHSRRARSIVGIYISIRDSCRLIPPPPVFGEYNSQDRCKSIATPSRFCFSNASISYNFEIRPPRTRNGME